MCAEKIALKDSDYADLADFRAALRGFQAFSEAEAAEAGLTPQQHQVLLAIRGAEGQKATVGFIAERLILKPHSASELVNRLEALDLILRSTDQQDKRRTVLMLTQQGEAVLATLSNAHRQEIQRLKPMLVALLDRFG